MYKTKDKPKCKNQKERLCVLGAAKVELTTINLMQPRT